MKAKTDVVQTFRKFVSEGKDIKTCNRFPLHEAISHVAHLAGAVHIWKGQKHIESHTGEAGFGYPISRWEVGQPS